MSYFSSIKHIYNSIVIHIYFYGLFVIKDMLYFNLKPKFICLYFRLSDPTSNYTKLFPCPIFHFYKIISTIIRRVVDKFSSLTSWISDGSVYTKDLDPRFKMWWIWNTLCISWQNKCLQAIEQKEMTFYHDFGFSFSFTSSLFLGGKRKGEKNNQSRG